MPSALISRETVFLLLLIISGLYFYIVFTWRGNNDQPLVRKLNTKKTIWTCYEHIARVVSHIDIDGYMDNVLNTVESERATSQV